MLPTFAFDIICVVVMTAVVVLVTRFFRRRHPTLELQPYPLYLLLLPQMFALYRESEPWIILACNVVGLVWLVWGIRSRT